jgi:hypothetical protein
MLWIRDTDFETSRCFSGLETEKQFKLNGYWDEGWPLATTIVFGGVGQNMARSLKVNVDIDEFAPVRISGGILAGRPGTDIVGDVFSARALSKLTPGKYEKVLIEHVGERLEDSVTMLYGLLKPGGTFEWQSFRYVMKDNDIFRSLFKGLKLQYRFDLNAEEYAAQTLEFAKMSAGYKSDLDTTLRIDDMTLLHRAGFREIIQKSAEIRDVQDEVVIIAKKPME